MSFGPHNPKKEIPKKGLKTKTKNLAHLDFLRRGGHSPTLDNIFTVIHPKLQLSIKSRFHLRNLARDYPKNKTRKKKPHIIFGNFKKR
jgi:hypothetical protein